MTHIETKGEGNSRRRSMKEQSPQDQETHKSYSGLSEGEERERDRRILGTMRAENLSNREQIQF